MIHGCGFVYFCDSLIGEKEVKKKKSKGEEKKAEAEGEQNGKKKERKVYDLPGQKRDPPEEVNSCLVFGLIIYFEEFL